MAGHHHRSFGRGGGRYRGYRHPTGASSCGMLMAITFVVGGSLLALQFLIANPVATICIAVFILALVFIYKKTNSREVKVIGVVTPKKQRSVTTLVKPDLPPVRDWRKASLSNSLGLENYDKPTTPVEPTVASDPYIDALVKKGATKAQAEKILKEAPYLRNFPVETVASADLGTPEPC